MGPVFGDCRDLYHSLVRRLKTSKAQLDKYSQVVTVPMVSSERTLGPRATVTNIKKHEGWDIPDFMKKLMTPLDFDAADVTRERVARFTFEGQWPLSVEGLGGALYDEPASLPFLPSGANLLLRLIKRDNLFSAWERALVDDASYYSATNSTHAREDLKLEIQDLFVMAEVRQVTGDEGGKKDKHYFAEVPKGRLSTMASGQLATTTELQVPAGTKYCILGWPLQHQLHYQKNSNKNLSSRLIFPRNCVSLRTFYNNEELGWENGLRDLATTKASTSPSCEAYHSWLVDNKLFEREVEALFPRTNGEYAYTQVYIVDFRHLPMKEPGILRVDLGFNDVFSPPKTYLMSFMMSQWKYTGDKNEIRGEPVI